MSGDPILQTARSAGIGGDVAANRAIIHAGRIGWIKQLLRTSGCLEAPMKTPGSTMATASVKWTSLIRFMSRNDNATPRRDGTQLPT